MAQAAFRFSSFLENPSRGRDFSIVVNVTTPHIPITTDFKK